MIERAPAERAERDAEIIALLKEGKSVVVIARITARPSRTTQDGQTVRDRRRHAEAPIARPDAAGTRRTPSPCHFCGKCYNPLYAAYS